MKTNWWKTKRRGAIAQTIDGRESRLKERGRHMEQVTDE